MSANALRDHPNRPASGTVLCEVAEIPVKGRGFVFGEGRDAFRLFVVRRESQVHCYVNICPHFGVPLDSGRDRFLNFRDTHIFCTQHCAEFRIEDGLCVDGPPKGYALEPVDIMVSDGKVIVA